MAGWPEGQADAWGLCLGSIDAKFAFNAPIFPLWLSGPWHRRALPLIKAQNDSSGPLKPTISGRA